MDESRKISVKWWWMRISQFKRVTERFYEGRDTFSKKMANRLYQTVDNGWIVAALTGP